MATLAEIRAKLQASSQQNTAARAVVTTAFIHTGICQKVQLLQFDSFLTQTQTILFSGLNEQ